MKKYLVVIILFLSPLNYVSYAQQDTLRYMGLAKISGGNLLINSFEFYPDKTFKYEWLYDLTITEFGYYEKNDDMLTLYFYETDIFSDKPPKDKKVVSKVDCKIEKYRLYLLKKNGRKRKRIRLSVYSFWRNPFKHLFGVKYEIFKTEEGKDADGNTINIIKN